MAYRTRKCASRRRKASRRKTYRRVRRGGSIDDVANWIQCQAGSALCNK
jgi:hypothetical protein